MRQVYYFSTTTCAPCKMFGPVVDQVKAEGINITKIDAAQNLALAQQYGVVTVPTVAIVENGILVKKSSGAMSKQQLISFINS